MPQPLSGLLVLDFTTLLPGPLATLMLAEAGAVVIKIERPGRGEEMRNHLPLLDDWQCVSFTMLNRGKKGLVLDLKRPDAQAQLAPLLARADILVEQFRPGVMERLGLGYARRYAVPTRASSIARSAATASAGRAPARPGTTSTISAPLACSPSILDRARARPCRPPSSPISAGARFRPSSTSCSPCGNVISPARGSYLDIAMTDAMFTFAW